MKSRQQELGEMLRELMATTNAFRQSILLLTANRFDLFTLLGLGNLSAQEIASELGWDERATAVFLNALTALGLVQKLEGQFSNTAISRRLLVKGLPDYQGDILNHNLNLWQRWSKMGEVLRTGKPLRDPTRKRSEEELRNFISGMANLARFSAGKLWDQIDLSGRKTLLDVGGGPGTYSFAACKRNQNLEAVVYDLPEVEPIFNEHREDAGVGHRVRFHAGDFQTDSLPSGLDVVLLSSIIHSYGESDNVTSLKKIHEVLLPGGLLLVKDFYISVDGTQPLHAALFAVNMLLGTPSGGCYTRHQVESWLKEIGFAPRDYLELDEQSAVIVVEK